MTSSTERRVDVSGSFTLQPYLRVQLLCNRSVEERYVDYGFRSFPLARATCVPSPRAPGMNHIHSLLVDGQVTPAGAHAAPTGTKGKRWNGNKKREHTEGNGNGQIRESNGALDSL